MHSILFKFNGLCATIVISSTLLLGGCGGGADSPIPEPPARVWSAPRLSTTSYTDAATVVAHADACGGVVVTGRTSNGITAQRFSATSGWEAPVVVAAAATQAQSISVSSVPNVLYRDATDWYRARFDCDQRRWVTTTEFPVEYQTLPLPALTLLPITVDFSETYEGALLAAWPATDGRTIRLRENRGPGWSPIAPAAVSLATSANDTATQGYATSIYGALVVKARNGFSALVGYGAAGQFIAFRESANGDFLRTSEFRGCLGHFCLGYALYDAPLLELDGTATVRLSSAFGLTNQRDLFRITPAGLQSLWGPIGAIALDDALASVVRSDGVAQWYTFDPATLAGRIFEGGLGSMWTSSSEYEIAGCAARSCRAFSGPDANHLATVLNPGDSPAQVPTLAVSDRIAPGIWVGSYAVSLADVRANGPNATSTGNGVVQLIRFHATDTRQIIVAALKSSRDGTNYDITPFVLWK